MFRNGKVLAGLNDRSVNRWSNWPLSVSGFAISPSSYANVDLNCPAAVDRSAVLMNIAC